ncbi:hypothetical protein [Limimaricola cinnabarinus]|uniref:hypothetical protein n=1 Tax=Limimaricola cinnabarinus TaxID=1125964 RepID=UPI000408F3CF
MRLRSVTKISASPGAMPKAGAPIRAWVTVTRAKSGSSIPPAPRPVSAGISPLSAAIGETPVSGCEAWAVRPASAIRIPREAQATGPGRSATWPSGSPGML